MKIPKKLEPLLTGLFASIIIGILSFLSFETSTGFWLMFSFGSSTLIVLVFHDSEFAQPANVFFGHLLAIVIGILFNQFFKFPLLLKSEAKYWSLFLNFIKCPVCRSFLG